MIEIDGLFFEEPVACIYFDSLNREERVCKIFYTAITESHKVIAMCENPIPKNNAGGIVPPFPIGSPVINEHGKPETIINIMPGEFLDRLQSVDKGHDKIFLEEPAEIPQWAWDNLRHRLNMKRSYHEKEKN